MPTYRPKRTLRFALTLTCVSLLGTMANAQPTVRAHFINVGQGDATLFEFPCAAILIDAGSQDEKTTKKLIGYLSAFFKSRPDLNKTFELVAITHNHVDHNRALEALATKFTVKRYIDNGFTTGSGKVNAKWIRNNLDTDGRDIEARVVFQSDITGTEGHTNDFIDPVDCPDCNPEIFVLSGRRLTNPGWSQTHFKDQNNQSVVFRVNFGDTSFLLTGDLEEVAIEELLQFYDGTPETLDVDVYQVGHHGSSNGTTEELLEKLTPKISVISMGVWGFGLGDNSKFTTYAYGHPRREIVRLLRENAQETRPETLAMVADGQFDFKPIQLNEAVYATGWDGTIIIEASLTGITNISTIR